MRRRRHSPAGPSFVLGGPLRPRHQRPDVGHASAQVVREAVYQAALNAVRARGGGLSVPTGCRDYASDEADLVAWIDVRGWAAGDGPEVIFADAVTWRRERRVLLPRVTTLAPLVA